MAIARVPALLVVPVVLLVVAVACGDVGGSDVNPGNPAGVLEGRQLVTTSVIEDGVERPLVPGTEVRLAFVDGRVAASAGCNQLGGDYELDGDRLRVGALASTEMGCDPARHDQDEWLAGVLESEPVVGLDGREVTLRAGDTELVLVDADVAEPDRQLVGPTWTLESIVEGELASSVPDGVTATLRFGDDARLAVDTGCGATDADVTLAADRLQVAPLDLGEALLCEQSAAGVRAAVVGVLDAEPAYVVQGDVLTLDAGDRTLQYRAG